ncbi:hypothetical protein BDZ94DRAFT_1260396 [Collybia nuda]|uniref:Uncharacterized protein n=1 Tax=Collybia nuda TaxID=64659 RepID=A0A9P6CEF6_9AGAR|nr:hypothetical protein BDZ94DRAFT_1260396 [Collybia nuda]
MATPRSPQTPFSIPAQPKRSAFPSSIPSARRASTSSAVSSPNISSASVSTPSPLSPNAPTGIPTFRTLRSLLPFGPNKQPTPVSATVATSTNVLRSPFANFGSVRRSMTRERNASFSAELPVISIERTPDSAEEPVIRKSVSCSRLEKPLPDEPPAESEGSSNLLQEEDDTIVLSSGRPSARTPSPSPAVAADLSTILEADTSGISKHIPFSPDPSRSPSPPFTPNSQSEAQPEQNSSRPEQETDTDTSVLDLSTTHLTDQVLDAMMAEDSGSAKQWLNADKAIIIDEDDGRGSPPDAEPSFNLGALDPDLAALLSPHRLPPSSNVKHLSIIPQPRRISDVAQGSPNSPQFSDSNPSPSSPGFPSGPQKSLVRSRLPRQQSSLPRLRPPSVHSPISPAFTVTPTTPKSGSDDETRATTVRNSSSESFATQTQRHPPAPPSPLSSSLSASTHAPNSSASVSASTSNSTRSISSTSLSARRAAPQTRIVTPSTIASRAVAPPATSTPSMSSRFPSFSSKRPPLRQMLSGPSSPSEWGENIPPAKWGDMDQTSQLTSTSPSYSARTSSPSRPSIDSTTRGSLDRGPLRPSLESSPLAGENSSASPRIPFDSPERSVLQPSPRLPFETPARPSLDLLRSGIVRDRLAASTSSISALSARVRKRSMSVQERLGQSFRGDFTSSSGMDSHRRRDELGVDEGRPSSSLSGRLGRKAGGDRPPATEWLGPRTVKAFKAAGLMDFEREGERGGGNLSVVGRFASIRSTSEYSPRTHSRMAFSEAGGSALGGGSASRRGSGTFSQYGLMESPTFTASSGSRDTPRSASTAPTSVSGSSFGFLGRDREKDRDRDEMRELKDKHATETGALLGALSDSQRTTRMLRDENGELRDRLEGLGHVVVENEKLRRVVDDLRQEVGDLRMQLLKTGSRLGTWGGTGTGRRSGLSTPIPPNEDDTWSNPRPTNGDISRDRDQHRGTLTETNQKYDHLHPNHDRLDISGPASSSTPAAKTHHRRFSTTSSIFPVPPPNMTMLLHDNDHDDTMSNASMSHSRYSMVHTPPMSIRGKHNAQNSSIASVASISPTTANFSMVTGSPGSLFLRPEHEVHLGDLESLDLGVRGGDGEQGVDDDWD